MCDPKSKLIRITTVPVSLEKLLEGQLAFMSNYYRVTAVSSEPDRLAEVGKKEGVKVFCVNLTRKITPVSDLKALWKLYRYFRREKPFIVHTHTPKAGTVGMLAARLAGVPHRLHTVAGLPLLEARGIKRKILDRVERITNGCATRVYPNSRGLCEIMIRERLSRPEKLQVIADGSSNGIDTAHFDPALFPEEHKAEWRRQLNIEPDDFVFVFVGRLVGDKGINELVEVFGRLAGNLPKVRLLLVGPQEEELDPLQEGTRLQMNSNRQILWVGSQPDVRPYLAVSDALVFPSYREGFPNVVMQAGAMGLPAIVTDINGCNEIVTEGRNGLIVPVKDSGALEMAMVKMLNDQEMRDRLRRNARADITSRYERKRIWEALLAEYSRLEKG